MLAEPLADKKKVPLTSLENIEYSLTLDGVIELPQNLDAESFFDGLLDTLIEYAEKYNAVAGLSMEHGEYIEALDDEERA
jgi:hypothetical protein